MATVTPNLNLELPLGTENVSRQLINSNNTKIDTFAGEVEEALDSIGTRIQEIIDDTAGEGDTDKVWSADKSAKEVTDLKAEIDEKADVICKTIDTPASIITIEDGADDLPVREMRIAIEPVQEGTGDPSPNNVRPITGWTGAKVTRTGKNLLDKSKFKHGIGATERYGAYGVDSYNASVTNHDLFLEPGGYTVSLSGEDSTNAESIYVYDQSGTRIKVVYSNKVAIFTVESEGYFRIGIIIKSADFVSWDNYDIQLEKGSTATAYEPYQGETYPITFPTEAGTVYGGELTIHADGTGELVVDRAFYEFNGSESGWAVAGNQYKYIAKRVEPYKGTNPWGISNELMRNPIGNDGDAIGFSFANNLQIRIRYGLFTSLTVADAQAWLAEHPFQVCYELATSTAYQLSAPQIRTLLGLNHIWADTGDIESITYPVDTAIALINQTATIQSIIAGSDSPVAIESHAVGDVFICDNKLYKAKDAIAVGESIIEGSNVEQTTVAELIVKGPRFVCNFGLSKNEYVELNMTGVARAVAFVSGASTGRNGMIHVFSNGSSVYAESATSFNNVSVSYNNTNRTVKIQNTGNDDIYVDVLKFYGDIKGTWVMPLGI